MTMKTYADYLQGGGTALREFRDVGRSDGQVKVRCECGAWEWPFMLVDVRGFPVLLTEGYEFACNGCVSTWRRTAKSFEATDDFVHWSEWTAEWARRHGGSDEDILAEEIVVAREMGRAVKLVAREEGVYAQAVADGRTDIDADLARHRNKRIAMEARIAQANAEITRLQAKTGGAN